MPDFPVQTKPLQTKPRAWQEAHWTTVITHWLQGHLKTQVSLGEPASHDLAFIAQVHANGETYYFKAGDKTREATLTSYLAKAFPSLLPEVVAFDGERDWLLTRDAGHYLSTVAQANCWQEALANLALFHQRADTMAFEKLGCSRGNFETLAKRGEAFLRNTTYLQNWGMNEEQVLGLEHLIPRLYQAHENVAALGLKECPVHGDAYPMNVLVKEQIPVWFDWREASIAHPFMDVGWFLAWTFLPKKRELELLKTPDAATLLWASYLHSFGLKYAEADMNDAVIIALTHRMLNYHDRFYMWQSSTASPRPQYVPYFLKLLLRLQEVSKSV
jgi:Phosphotransferase enzyme family